MLFLCCNGAFGQELQVAAGSPESTVSQQVDNDKIGFTYRADLSVVSSYIWRGKNIAGLSFQPDLAIGYGGFEIGTWWNVGASDWTFTGFTPELDLYVSFSRYGLTLFYTHMHYFDQTDGHPTRFFDFKNYAPGGGGNSDEARISYRVSDKIPLTLLWCTRFTARDGYMVHDETTGEDLLKRAYSSYFEIGYDFKLPEDWVITAKLGLTPWKSLYTNYQGNFAVNNIMVMLSRDFVINNYCHISVYGRAMLNTYGINKNNVICPIDQRADQKLNANIGLNIHLGNN